MEPFLHDLEAVEVVVTKYGAVNTYKNLVDLILDYIAFNSISSLTCSLN